MSTHQLPKSQILLGIVYTVAAPPVFSSHSLVVFKRWSAADRHCLEAGINQWWVPQGFPVVANCAAEGINSQHVF